MQHRIITNNGLAKWHLMKWDEKFKNYAVDLAKMYIDYPEQVLSCLIFDSVTGSLNETYLSLIKDGLPKIEDLPRERKESLWKRSGNYGETKTKRIQVSRSIYLLEEITK